MLAQLPQAAEEIKAERRKARLMKRKEREAEKRAKRKKGDKEESESGSETDESDEEREAEQEVAMARYKWDRSAVSGSLCACGALADLDFGWQRSIEQAFRLAERSGITPTSVNTT